MKEEKRQAHPGWAIYCEDKTWLCYAHGYHCEHDAFYASIFTSEEEAQETLKDAQEDYKNTLPNPQIVVAWEPLCERLRFDIDQLKKANQVSPDDLFDLEQDIQDLLYRLKHLRK